MSQRLRVCAISALLLLGSGGAGAQNWLETRVELEGLAETGDYAGAIELGDRLLEQVRAEFGDDSTELADAHALLASIHRGQRKFEEAELQMLRAIEAHRAREGSVSTVLIEPLITLGEIYQQAGQHALALATYDEARTLGRREFGLLNQDQIAILDRMSATAIAMADRDEARELQREGLAIVQRFYGEDSLEFLDANYRYADWLFRNSSFQDARRVYLNIERLINLHYEEDPLLTVRLLQSSASTLRLNSVMLSGRTAPIELDRALKILDRLDNPDLRLRAEILRDMGDWNVGLRGSHGEKSPYLESWRLLGEVVGGDLLREEWFGSLNVIRARPIYSRVFSEDPKAPWGRIEVAFSIDTDGRPSGIAVVHANPAGVIDNDVVIQVANSLFRPQIDDGEFIDAGGTISWDFPYDPEWVALYTGNRAPGGP